MVQLAEGVLTFRFPAGWMAEKLDSTAFYREHGQGIAGGSKAVDFVAFSPRAADPELWLIEVKDYRGQRRTKTVDIINEVAEKVRDSLVCLLAVRSTGHSAGIAAFAERALTKRKIRIVLHLEQPASPSKLWRRIIDPANANIKLRQLLRALDPHARCLDRQAGQGRTPWSVQ